MTLYLAILKHIGKVDQAGEYLDFIHEDAPISSGYGRVHILSLLYIIYEGKGDKFRHMMQSVDTTFMMIRDEELTFLAENTGKGNNLTKDGKLTFKGV